MPSLPSMDYVWFLEVPIKVCFNMGKKESLQKKIDNLENKAKYYRTIVLTISSGLIWSIYAIMKNKADLKILILVGAGIVVSIFMLIRLKSYEIEIDELIEHLKKD